MGTSIDNWVSGDVNRQQVEIATSVLEKVKKKRYGEGKKYKLVKVSDHPATYEEVLMTPEEMAKSQEEEIDGFEMIDDGMSEETGVEVPKEEVISMKATFENVDFGLGAGKVEINIF